MGKPRIVILGAGLGGAIAAFEIKQAVGDKAEVEAWRHKEPIVRYQGWLEANRMVHPDDLARIESEVAAEIAEAVAFAEAGTWEPVEQLARFTCAEAEG